jgi:hypothetical protein
MSTRQEPRGAERQTTHNTTHPTQQTQYLIDDHLRAKCGAGLRIEVRCVVARRVLCLRFTRVAL